MFKTGTYNTEYPAHIAGVPVYEHIEGLGKVPQGQTFVVTDTRKSPRKPLNELKAFQPLEVKDFTGNEGDTDVFLFPVNQLSTDTARFQGRKSQFSEDSVNRIIEAVNNGTFSWAAFDPITIWLDNNGKYYVLSGHSRKQAFNQLANAGAMVDGKGFAKIPAKLFKGNEAEAIEYALKSNTLSTKESDTERALYYYNLRTKGTPEKDIKAEAKANEGRNANQVYAYSFLNPQGAVIAALEALERGDITSKGNLANIAAWTGSIRSAYPDLTNAHETEIYEWLKNEGYGTKTGQVSNLRDFNDLMRRVIERNTEFGTFKADQPLNIAAKRFVGDREAEALKNIQDAEAVLEAAKKAEIEARRKAAASNDLTDDERTRYINKYVLQTNNAQRLVLEAKQQLDKYRAADNSQQALFGVDEPLNITVNVPFRTDIKNELALVSQYAKPFAGKQFYAKAINKYVTIDETGIEHTIRNKYSPFKMALVPYLGLLIETASNAETQVNKDNKRLSVYLLKNEAIVNNEAYSIVIFIKEVNKAGEYYYDLSYKKKETLGGFSTTTLNRSYLPLSVSDHKNNTFILGATEIVENLSTQLNYNGFAPTYPVLSDYSHLIAKSGGWVKRQNGNDLEATIKPIQETLFSFKGQTSALAKHLYHPHAGQFAFNCWHWMKHNLKYAFDKLGHEEVRTPARTYADRLTTGADCEDYTIFFCSLALNAGFTPQMHIVAFNGKDAFGHIYPVLNGYVADAVTNDFNIHPANITKTMIIEVLGNLPPSFAGIGGLGALAPATNVTQTLIGKRNELLTKIKANRATQAERNELTKLNHAIQANGTDAQAEILAIMPFVKYYRNGTPVFNSPVLNRMYFAPHKVDINEISPREAADLDSFNAALSTVQTLKGVYDEDVTEDAFIEGLGRKAGRKKLKDTKIGKGLTKAWKGMKKIAPPLVAARAAWLLIVKSNIKKMGTRLAIGYLTPEQAAKRGIKPDAHRKLVAFVKASEQKYEKAGGNAKNLRKAAVNSKQGKRLGLRGIGLDGIDYIADYGIGVEPVSAGVAAAAIPAVIAILQKLLKETGAADADLGEGFDMGTEDAISPADVEAGDGGGFNTAEDAAVSRRVDESNTPTPEDKPKAQSWISRICGGGKKDE